MCEGQKTCELQSEAEAVERAGRTKASIHVFSKKNGTVIRASTRGERWGTARVGARCLTLVSGAFASG
jgi:hypothetical protein